MGNLLLTQQCGIHPHMKTIKPKLQTISCKPATSVATERRWTRTARERALQRDGYLCKVCQAQGIITAAQEVDHVVPLHMGGKDSINNMQSLCRPCHQLKSAQELAVRLKAINT